MHLTRSKEWARYTKGHLAARVAAGTLTIVEVDQRTHWSR